MTKSWQREAMRTLRHSMALCAAMLGLVMIVAPAQAQTQTQTVQTATVVPLPIPADVAELRTQPALGATLVPVAPGQQALTPQLLANYVERQRQLRAVDVLNLGPRAALNTEVLMGYIEQGAITRNSAVSAIASFAAAPATSVPDLNPSALAAYIDAGYQPTEQRVQQANAERDCLAQAIYHEARGESAAGQLAVANVIVNRARSTRFPATLCGVIYQNADKGRYRCQFTFACDGRSEAPGERSAWARSTALAHQVYAEFATGEALGAVPRSTLYYHTTNVRPNWANTYTAVAQIGSHIFYSPN